MPVSVIFPKFNLEKTSGEISNWSVSEGDKVSAGDILFEVEDDKAAVEVDTTESGFIGGLAAVGEEIDVGSVVAVIYSSKEELEAAASSDAGTQVEDKPSTKPQAAVAAKPSVALETTPSRNGAVRSTPLARRIARDNGISIEGLAGTGPKGRIQKRDVLAALENSDSAVGVKPAMTPSFASSDQAGELNAVWYQKGEGLPVALIHGFAADYASWGGLLSGARYAWPALALDLPCHGKSDSDVPASLDAMAARVETTLLAQGVTEAVLAAHSLGSAVAARVASRGALRIKALCLFAPAGISAEINPGFVAGMLRARSVESLQPWLLQLVEDESLITEAFCQRAMEARTEDSRFAALQRFGQQFLPDGTQRFSVLEDLRNYQGPLRVVHGRQDRIIPVEATHNLPGNAAVHLWDRCGHMPQLEQRKEALRVLEEVRRSC